MKIYCFGDSLTRGYGVQPAQSYPAQLQQRLLLRQKEVTVLNFGKDGLPIEELRENLPGELVDAGSHDIVLLLIGSNNVLNLRSPVERYAENLRWMVDFILLQKMKLYLATLPPIEVEYIYIENPLRRMLKYNDVIRAVGKEKGVPVVELADLDDALLSDGIHFGSQGYGEMAECWLKALEL